MPNNSYKLDDILRPEAKEQLRHLEMFARRLVDGLRHGIHRSRRKGVSTEFDHHKMYQPGDPLKHIDWKASARLDKYYVKRYLEDTSLGVRIILDRSASMQQQTDDHPSKYLSAARLAASLAYLILKEKDAVGLVTTADDETFWQPVRSSEAHLVRILQALASKPPAGADNLVNTIRAVVDRGERKGMVILISDMMYDPIPVQKQLARLTAQGHEVLVCQLRDPTEEDFPFNRWVMFGDLEDASVHHRLDTVPLKKIYLEEYQLLLDEWRTWAKKFDVHFVTSRTTDSVETILSEYLHFRQERQGA